MGETTVAMPAGGVGGADDAGGIGEVDARMPDVPRSQLGDSWGWLWKDTLMRLVPFAVASGVYARVAGKGAAGVGITGRHVLRDAALGAALGVPLSSLAVWFRGTVIPGYRLPTVPDQIVQTAYYCALNAPVEELFWRGAVQTAAVDGLRALPATRRMARPLGWAATTAVFGAYHRLGGWSWRSIAGVTAAGGLFGALYLARPHPSLALVTLLHGFMTAGFLSWGDETLHRRALRRHRATLTRADMPHAPVP